MRATARTAFRTRILTRRCTPRAHHAEGKPRTHALRRANTSRKRRELHHLGHRTDHSRTDRGGRCWLVRCGACSQLDEGLRRVRRSLHLGRSATNASSWRDLRCRVPACARSDDRCGPIKGNEGASTEESRPRRASPTPSGRGAAHDKPRTDTHSAIFRNTNEPPGNSIRHIRFSEFGAATKPVATGNWAIEPASSGSSRSNQSGANPSGANPCFARHPTSTD